MDEMMTKFIDGHKLTVYRLISPGLGIWFNGYIDGKQSVSTGGLSQDKNTKEDCYKALLAKLKEITAKEK